MGVNILLLIGKEEEKKWVGWGRGEETRESQKLSPFPPPHLLQLSFGTTFFLFFKAIVVFVEFFTIFFVLSPSSFRETEIIQNQDIN